MRPDGTEGRPEDELAAALTRVADGGTALDPEVVSQLFRASRHADGLPR
jgi:hypothetical protein